MRPLLSPVLAPLLSPVLALLPLPALAQDRPDPMVLIEPTPRLPCSGSDSGAEPACKINAALLALDQAALTLPCPPLDAAAEGLDPGRDPLQMYYAHWVDVTLDGKRLYSLLLHSEVYCPGGAHGWTDLSTALFDLRTGEKLDPFALLPADLVQRPGALASAYLAAASLPEDCAAIVTQKTGGLPGRAAFLAYPEPGGLTLIPRDLPHAVRS